MSFGDTPGRELGDPVPLRTRHGRRGLLLSVAQWYVVRHFPEDPSVPDADRRGPYKVSTTSYDYSILDEDEHELLAWQWDPRGKGTKPFPHLHIGAGVGAVHLGEMVEPLPVDKMHIPTGRVLVEDVIRSIIEEMGVEPLRSDWDTILRDNTEAFRRGRTW
ncbi:MAG: hypothetical protein M3Q71_11005 [Chloroflexota bacterium]|nr:hypothetical protein [Chloroflexota bacterium]